MKPPDLVFHLVSKRKWKERQKSGFYRSVAGEETGDDWIVCYTASMVERIANEKFGGRKTIMMLVINTQRLATKLEFRENEGELCPMVYKRINLDAIIDKIALVPDEKGLFEISIEVK